MEGELKADDGVCGEVIFSKHLRAWFKSEELLKVQRSSRDNSDNIFKNNQVLWSILELYLWPIDTENEAHQKDFLKWKKKDCEELCRT